MPEGEITRVPNNVDEMTERVLDDAVKGAGMRAFESDCVRGAVSYRRSQRVGDQGHVVAVDYNPLTVQLARGEARET